MTDAVLLIIFFLAIAGIVYVVRGVIIILAAIGIAIKNATPEEIKEIMDEIG